MISHRSPPPFQGPQGRGGAEREQGQERVLATLPGQHGELRGSRAPAGTGAGRGCRSVGRGGQAEAEPWPSPNHLHSLLLQGPRGLLGPKGPPGPPGPPVSPVTCCVSVPAPSALRPTRASRQPAHCADLLARSPRAGVRAAGIGCPCAKGPRRQVWVAGGGPEPAGMPALSSRTHVHCYKHPMPRAPCLTALPAASESSGRREKAHGCLSQGWPSPSTLLGPSTLGSPASRERWACPPHRGAQSSVPLAHQDLRICWGQGCPLPQGCTPCDMAGRAGPRGAGFPAERAFPHIQSPLLSPPGRDGDGRPDRPQRKRGKSPGSCHPASYQSRGGGWG